MACSAPTGARIEKISAAGAVTLLAGTAGQTGTTDGTGAAARRGYADFIAALGASAPLRAGGEAFAAADDFAVTFRCEQVATHRVPRLFRIFLHVEGFNRSRKVVDKNWGIKF